MKTRPLTQPQSSDQSRPAPDDSHRLAPDDSRRLASDDSRRLASDDSHRLASDDSHRLASDDSHRLASDQSLPASDQSLPASDQSRPAPDDSLPASDSLPPSLKELRASLAEIDALRFSKECSAPEREALELTAVALRDAERLAIAKSQKQLFKELEAQTADLTAQARAIRTRVTRMNKAPKILDNIESVIKTAVKIIAAIVKW